MEKKCNICKGINIEKIYRKNNYDLLKCKNCGLVFVWPQPGNKELAKIYSYKSGYFEGVDFQDEALDPFFKKIFERKHKGNFLDIGSGTGYIVHTAKRCGWNSNGIDLNKDIVKQAKKKGLNVLYKDIMNFKGKKDYYDVILMGDLIEHVKDPEKVILKVRDLLKKGGILIVSTPNINSFFPKYSFIISRIFKITWAHPSPPYHLFEFSNTNFLRFLEKEGFKIESIEYSNIPLMYTIGNTSIFRNFKEIYRKNRSVKKSLIKNNPFNSLLIGIVFVLYLPGYLISKKLKIKNSMKIIAKK